jgi:hypothetical protein
MDRATGWRIGVQRQVRICGQDPLKMPCAEDENVIQTVAPQRSDQAFRIWVLPRRAR